MRKEHEAEDKVKSSDNLLHVEVAEANPRINGLNRNLQFWIQPKFQMILWESFSGGLKGQCLRQLLCTWLEIDEVTNINYVNSSMFNIPSVTFECRLPYFGTEPCRLILVENSSKSSWILLCQDETSQKILKVAGEACCATWGLHHIATIAEYEDILIKQAQERMTWDNRTRRVYLSTLQLEKFKNGFKFNAPIGDKFVLWSKELSINEDVVQDVQRLTERVYEEILLETGCRWTFDSAVSEVFVFRWTDRNGKEFVEYAISSDSDRVPNFFEERGLHQAKNLWFGTTLPELDLCLKQMSQGGLVGAIKNEWQNLKNKFRGHLCIGLSVGCFANVSHMYPPLIQRMNLAKKSKFDNILMLLIDPALPKKPDSFYMWKYGRVHFLAINHPYLPSCAVEDGLAHWLANLAQEKEAAGKNFQVVLTPGEPPIENILDSLNERIVSLNVPSSLHHFNTIRDQSSEFETSLFADWLPSTSFIAAHGPFSHVGINSLYMEN